MASRARRSSRAAYNSVPIAGCFPFTFTPMAALRLHRRHGPIDDRCVARFSRVTPSAYVPHATAKSQAAERNAKQPARAHSNAGISLSPFDGREIVAPTIRNWLRRRTIFDAWSISLGALRTGADAELP